MSAGLIGSAFGPQLPDGFAFTAQSSHWASASATGGLQTARILWKTEIMEFVFEIILQFLGELLLQAIFELLVELGFHSLADTFRRPKNPALSILGFTLWGAIAGGISLWIFPTSPIDNPVLREINLVVTPVACGLVMMMVGKLRLRKGQDIVRLDQFGYAFVFAFAMALVRFAWAA
ncbi:MAG TPA: hypothetical protein VFH89_05735 [Sphingomicrobium sp.]|nr:hypothetical protein [Sphingomicrobium sp.]